MNFDFLKKLFMPDPPPAPVPLQQNQDVADFSGYQRTTPPAQVDFGALGNAISSVGNGLSNFLGERFGRSASSAIPAVAPVTGGGDLPSPSPAAVAPPDNLEEVIRRGYQVYGGGNTPLATMSAQLAEAGRGLPDPRLPAALGIKETSGGVTTNQQTRPNNALSVLAERQDYPSLEANISGRVGDQRISFKELMSMPEYNAPYQTYFKSGDPADFFRAYTPDHDKYGNRNSNPTIADQVAEYNRILEQYFSPR